MLEIPYEALRATQALCAGVGVWLSASNLIEAVADRRWLTSKGLNGLRTIMADSVVWHEAGRVGMQFILCLIGILGVILPHGANAFDRAESLLDTAVVVVVLAISMHSRHVRTVVRRYRED